MTGLASCLYRGIVHHRRHSPVEHRFDYRIFLVYLDLAELETVFTGRWLWSTRRIAVARFSRSDHLGEPSQPLDESVRDLVEARLGRRPLGPIRLLTNLRYWGYVFNPLSLFYCFCVDGKSLEAVVAEVNNTPWGERHPYVLPGEPLQHQFRKEFHVSPFLPMDLDYHWRFTVPGESLAVQMGVFRGEQKVFDATMALGRAPITTGTLAGSLLRHPFMTAKVIAAIHWQALRLWLKKVPFHQHPRRHVKPGEPANR